jgi:hypothetical protein
VLRTLIAARRDYEGVPLDQGEATVVLLVAIASLSADALGWHVDLGFMPPIPRAGSFKGRTNRFVPIKLWNKAHAP